MKKILFLLLPLIPALALAQTGTVKDSVRVLTTAEIQAGQASDTANFYFIQNGQWRKINMDSLDSFLRRKRAGDRGDIDVSTDGLTWTVDTNAIVAVDIQNGAVDSTKLALGAVVLPGAKVTGTLPVSKGGTGLTTFGGAGRMPYATSATSLTTNSNLTYNGSQLQTNKLILSDATTNYSQIVIENQLNGDARRGGLGVQAFDNLKNVGIFSLISANGLHNINFGGGVSDLYVPTRIWFHTDGYNKTGSSSTTLRVAIDSFGNMGLGTAFNDVISEKLHVVGNVRITAMNGINDIGASATGVLQAATSDYNLKNSIEDSGFGLNHILQLRPVTFLYNDQDRKIHSEIPEVGFIAQDVNDVIPNAVSPTGEGTLQLDYRAITATLVKAMQEQQVQIQALQQRIIQLENK